MKSISFVYIFVFVGFAASYICHDVKPKEYIIDLDLPEEERWLVVLKDRTNITEEINSVIKAVLSRIPKEFREPAMAIMGDLIDYLPPTYAREMKGIAKYLNISAAEVVLANVLYDYTAFCTSIVAQDSSGRIWHGRNLDYDFTDFLRNTTIVAHFYRKGKPVYSATTYVGIVGVLTGQKPHVFTISMDQRDKGAFWMNILTAVLDKKAKHAVFLIRDLLENSESYEEMLESLQATDTIAPAYYIVGGTLPGQGAVVTRARVQALDVWKLDADTSRWFVVETNYDHWVPPPKDDDRRHPAIKYMNAVGQTNVSAPALYKVLSTPPILRPTTTYTTIMSAAHPEIYSTTVRYFKP